MFSKLNLRRLALGCVSVWCGAAMAFGQAVPNREFVPGSVRRVEDLPPGRARTQIERLPQAARDRALARLAKFHFTEEDLASIKVDRAGGIFYADKFTLAAHAAAAEGGPLVAGAPVPVSSFPASLKFHSRPGATNVLFLNFGGENVTGTEWNTEYGRSTFSAVAFSTDGDYSTFSDAEQLAIKRIWQRVAEDYAPFNVDVTTERPATFHSRTAHALITRSTDANGFTNPEGAGAGGVAYVDVFADVDYATYRPAWIYVDNLGSEESYIAEATSHEIGHNLGLSHDGRKSAGAEYYGGHGSGDTSWGPIMGTGYGRNVSQWSKGEYYLANNTQDDLAIISAKMPYRPDDHGNTRATATTLTVTAGTRVVATTPENDPTNANAVNKGIIERNTDVDVFSFVTGTGFVSLTVNPWITPGGMTRGGNTDISVELYDTNGALLLTHNPGSQTFARVQTNLSEGIYYLHVRNSGTGSPTVYNPTGYTLYGSLGQYFITGSVVAASAPIPPSAALQITDISSSGVGAKTFSVTYTDNTGVDVSTIDGNDVIVTCTNGYSRAAQLVSMDVPSNGTPRVATYSITPPNGVAWTAPDAGVYSVMMRSNEVRDIQSAAVSAATLGQFMVNVPNDYTVTVSANNAAWGSAAPVSQSVPAGSSVTITASPADYFRFSQWNGSVISTNNPLNVVVNSNMTFEAAFAEIVTTNHSTPYWWLAAHGVTSGLEAADSLIGANGIPLWQSEVAGLDPNDPASQLRVTVETGLQPGAIVLSWNPVAGRVYTVLESSEFSSGFAPVLGAANLPATISAVTNSFVASISKFYRLQVQKP